VEKLRKKKKLKKELPEVKRIVPGEFEDEDRVGIKYSVIDCLTLEEQKRALKERLEKRENRSFDIGSNRYTTCPIGIIVGSDPEERDMDYDECGEVIIQYRDIDNVIEYLRAVKEGYVDACKRIGESKESEEHDGE